MSFAALAKKLESLRCAGRPLLLGISGAQGTGKSTLAAFLQATSTKEFGWNVANLSLDDFYLTRDERLRLSEDVHPLLATRGVPGTHDVTMLSACLDDLCTLAAGDSKQIPRFDKASDDRAAQSTWPSVTGPVDLVILEGWCVGAQAQSDLELESACNDLERNHDPDGAWRKFVNAQLKNQYTPVFKRLDYLLFLAAPGFEAIRRWRWQQEQELAERSAGGPTRIMSERELLRFMQHYERLTRAMLRDLPDTADFVYYLDDAHDVVNVRE